MSLSHWIDNDAGYEQWLSENPDGFMANINREPHARYLKIHRATHRLPDRSNPGSINPRTGNNYSKVTANGLSELLEWANEKIPQLEVGHINYCKTCNPLADLPIVSDPTADLNEYLVRADQLLARGPIQRPLGIQKPSVQKSDVMQYYRDPKVRAWALQRAAGYCELCEMPAPFMTEEDDLFLESHHLIWLSQGGPDTPENTAALCPNCHRQMHYGKNRIQLRESLSKSILAKEATSHVGK